MNTNLLIAIWLTITAVGLTAGAMGFGDALSIWIWQRENKINGARHLVAAAHVRNGSLRLIELIAAFTIGILGLFPGQFPQWFVVVLLFVIAIGATLGSLLDYLDRRKIAVADHD